MKAFGNILFILVLFAIGYATYPSLSEHLGWNKSAKPVVVEDRAIEDIERTTDTGDTTPPVTPTTKIPTPPKGDSESEIDKRFPYPNIRSLEEITGNWTAIPANAMPKQITLKKDLQFTLGATGSITKPAGSEVYPIITTADGQVKVRVAPNSATESMVAIDDTDMKQRVTEKYDAGVASIHAKIDARRAAERTRIAAASTVTDEEKATAGAVPTNAREQDDYIGHMKDSIARGELSDLAPSQIIEWRFLGFEKVDGQGYWTGAAVYNVETLFGEFQTEAKALIREGKVVRWIRMEE